MAIFGIDDAPDMPVRAIKAAIDMLSAADRMKHYMKTMYDVDFDVGIGLHYGDAVIGTVSGGREERLTAIGETVNVASRIEGANKEAGTRLLISEALYRQTEKEVEVSDFVRVRLRGRRGRDSGRRAAGFRVRGVRPCRSTQGREVLRLQQFLPPYASAVLRK